MSTYTQSLGLELITPGSQAGLWGNTTNNTFTLIDQAICGVTPLSFASASGSTITLTDYNGAEDEARSAVLNITGTAVGSNNVVVPNKQKTYLVRNNTGQDVVFKTASAGSTYTVGAGYSILIFCDGNNNVFTGIQSPSTGTLSVNGGGTGATTFTAGFIKSPGGTSALTSASTVALGSEVSGTLPVANGGTGLTSLTANSVLLVNGSGAVTPTLGGASGQVLTWNGSAWGAAAPTTAPVTSVNGLTGAVTLTASSVGAPTTTGSGASGTWGINVTGSAGSVPQISGSSWLLIMGGSLQFGYSATVPFTMNNDGRAYASVAWIDASDSRIKENVTSLSSGLDTVSKLNPVKFSYKRDGLSSPNSIGLIAQEVESVVPEAVSNSGLDEGDIKDVKGVSYSAIVPVLIKAIQELKAEVDALKAAK